MNRLRLSKHFQTKPPLGKSSVKSPIEQKALETPSFNMYVLVRPFLGLETESNNAFPTRPLVAMHAQNIVLQHKGARHMRRLHYSEAKPDSADRSLRRAPFEGFGSSMVKHIRFYHKTV